MLSEDELIAAVDSAFELAGRELPPWPNPRLDRRPLEEEYSRLTNPARWRIVGARADAWLKALADTGFATVEPNASVRWQIPSGPVLTRVDRAVPRVHGALPLIVARSRLGSVDDGGVTLGVGDPAVLVTWIPHCGCDACDSGSQYVLDQLDQYVLSVVSGDFRRLSSRGREITAISKAGGRRWSASGGFQCGEVDAILDDPTGWDELGGTSWLGDSEV